MRLPSGVKGIKQVRIFEMKSKLLSRRKFAKFLGLSSAGASLAAAVEVSKHKVQAGGEEAKEEIEKLKKAYTELDARSKLILRLMLVFTGLDIFI
jgi:hypothetical protein